MMGEKSKVANAVGGRTARACDSCLRRRARWFCAADDAFLCQSCDNTVHGANQLASRHERVRLQTSSFKGSDNVECSPAWHRGFTRKPRTPRRQRKAKNNNDDVDFVEPPLPFVPEMSSEDDQSQVNDDKEHLLCQVPVFDKKLEKADFGELGKESPFVGYDHDEFDHQIQGFLESELELAEFAADVESLLGVSTIEDDQSCQLDSILSFKEEEEDDDDFNIDIDVDIGVDVDLHEVCTDLAQSVVKVENDSIEQPRLGFQVSPNVSTKDEGKLESDLSRETTNKRNILLRLNYEAVIDAWDSQGSPWKSGIRPIVKPEHGWPECLDDIQNQNGDCGFGRVGSGRSDAGRQARVLRYREKRRTRLFSKKIRYEVRKLNAEKRPRMKGRFVKRTSFMGPNINVPTFIPSTTTFPYQYHYINQ